MGHGWLGVGRKRHAWAAAVFFIATLAGLWSGGQAWSAPDETAIREAAALRAAGRFPEALEVLRIESRRIKSLEGEGSPGLLTINDLAAEILVDSGELESARALLEKTIAARRKLGDKGWNDQAQGVSRSLLVLARLETMAKRLPAAADAARQALVVSGGVAGPGDEGLARAQAALLEAIDAIEVALGPAAADTLRARQEAAAALASLGFFAQAVEQERRHLESLLLPQDPDAEKVAAAAVRLGRLTMDAGLAADASELVQKSLDAVRERDPREANAIRRVLGELEFSTDNLALAAGSFDAALEAARGFEALGDRRGKRQVVAAPCRGFPRQGRPLAGLV